MRGSLKHAGGWKWRLKSQTEARISNVAETLGKTLNWMRDTVALNGDVDLSHIMQMLYCSQHNSLQLFLSLLAYEWCIWKVCQIRGTWRSTTCLGFEPPPFIQLCPFLFFVTWKIDSIRVVNGLMVLCEEHRAQQKALMDADIELDFAWHSGNS